MSDSFLDRMASPDGGPAGGSAAAYAGAMAAALVSMCSAITGDELAEERDRADVLRRELADLAEEDARAFALYLETRSDDNLKHATKPPVLIAEKSSEVLLLAQRAGHKIKAEVKPDLQGAMRLADAAYEQSLATARFNLGAIEDKAWVEAARARLARIL